MEENKFYSYNHKDLPKGCQYCIKGQKMVIFLTGICPRKCYFCPLSDDKFQKDVIFANERPIISSKELIEEAELMDAKGAGITGGDPLAKLDRTLRYITTLKKHFGSHFHIHIYTTLRLTTEPVLQKLYKAGLDEIRFHPDLDASTHWKKIAFAEKFPWQVGIEIPCIPGKEKEIKKLIDYSHPYVDFLNLNELEVADNQQSKLIELGFETKDDFSYAVKGSLELGKELIQYVQEKEYPLAVHICTAKLKDATQLSNRIKRQAQGAKLPFDIIDEEGMLTRGALYLEELSPGAGYREKLKEDHEEIIERLKELQQEVKKLNIKTVFDEKKPRILISKSDAKKHVKKFKKLNLKPAIVTEYPTYDQLEVEVEFL
ncbi:radical SAM protein [Candidatus Woesearchaeota archaeon]|jgi:uncharacterized protein|nr:radical SAM protein [Candidatus Woesearchaeota archaeon]